MAKASTVIRCRTALTGVVMALLLAWVVAPTGAAAHPGGHPAAEEPTGLGVEVTSPDVLAGFFPAVQWGDTGEVDDQTAELVYAGTGCTPASYAPVAQDIQGNIALVDSRVSETNPADQCPAFTFLQKVRSAQHAGAIGFVQIPAEGEEPRANATAVTADIPALEVERTDDVVKVRDAVIAGEAVEAILRNIQETLGGMTDVACVDGRAGPFECDGIDLLALVPQEEFNGAGVSDIWGWTDPESGDEYVIMGKTNGVAFFRVTDPTDPVYLGELPNPGVVQEVWHDIKVYDNHAFVVSESEPHGMTVFDLTRLRDVDGSQEWDADAFYRLNSAAHNLEINTETGFAYILGGNVGIVVPDQCLSGLHMVDIRDPKQPTFAGCYLEEGGPGTAARSVGGPVAENSPAAYVHDAQCVIYDGPDERYTGREICFNSAEDKVVVVDVTDKLNPVTLGVTDYPNVGYTHQGWLTDDDAYLIINDELDEVTYGIETRTVVLDVTNLEDPKLHFEHTHEGSRAITHNNYVHDGFVYQSNYAAGLRVLDVSGVAERTMEEVAFFDTFPTHSDTTFDGTWSNYPFFESGTIAVSGRAEGLFLLRARDGALDPAEPGVEVTCTDCPVEIRAGESGTTHLAVSNTGNVDDTYQMTVEGTPEGWTATADPDEVSVVAGDDTAVAVSIEVPRRARAGTYTFTVTATSTEHPGVSASEEVEVEVRKGKPSEPGASQEPGPSEEGGAPGHDDQTRTDHTRTDRSGEDADVLAMTEASSSGGPTVPATALLVLAVALLTASTVRRHRTRWAAPRE